MASPEISQCHSYNGTHSPTLLDHPGPGILPLPHATQRTQGASQQILEPPEGTPPLNLRTVLEEKDRRLAVQDRLIASLKAEVKRLTETVSKQQEKIEQLQAENAQQHTEILQLRAENKQQREEIAQLKQTVAQLQGENAQLRGENLSQREEIASLRAENTKLKRKMKQRLAEAAQKAARQQEKIEQLEAEIVNLREENAQQRVDFRQELAAWAQRADERLAASEQRAAEQLAASEQRAAAEREALQQQLTASEQRAAEQLAASEQRAAEQLAASEQKAAEKLAASERQAAAQQEALKQQVAAIRNAEQRKWDFLHFGNFLLLSFDAHARALSKGPCSGPHAFANFINHEAPGWNIYATGGVFAWIAYYDDLGQLESSQNGRYFDAVYRALSNYKHLSRIPGSSLREKVFNLSRLVASCRDERNEIAHKTTKEQARDAVGTLVEKHGIEWEPFMREVTK